MLPLTRLALVLAAGVALMLPGQALASGTLLTSFQDDKELLYSPPSHVLQQLELLKSLGVDQIKANLTWALVAPDPNSKRRPSFNAADPTAYPNSGWFRYDYLAYQAHQLGMSVYFEIVPQVPRWAVSRRGKIRLGLPPDPTDFEQFVQAVGTRYSGAAEFSPIPRVTTWAIWNEPNWYAWLDPFYGRLPNGQGEFLQPPLYRMILNAGWSGLKASGHTPATDTILIGETANAGPQSPTAFIRSLYCVDARNRMLRGAAAAQVGCPTSPSRSGFTTRNPALFQASGYAHHPWSFNVAPNRNVPNWFTPHNLGALERLLNGILKSYGTEPAGGFPLYMTEFGYESNPPNPLVRNSLAQQAVWLNEAEYEMWALPFVNSFSQFQLVDSGPNTMYKPGQFLYWHDSIDSGLEFQNDKPKPALQTFRLPIWLPAARHGGHVFVWGQLRPADRSQPQTATLEFAAHGSQNFVNLAPLQTTSSEGFVTTSVAIPSAGFVRIAWQDASTGTTYYSRSVYVS